MPHYTWAERDFLRLLSFWRISVHAHVKWGFCGKAVTSIHSDSSEPLAFQPTALMHEAALSAAIDVDRLSFLHAVRVVRRKLPLFEATPP